MRFRPCIDIHDGKVKQIVGSTLNDSSAKENFVADKGADHYASIYRDRGLKGGHITLTSKNVRTIILHIDEYECEGIVWGI